MDKIGALNKYPNTKLVNLLLAGEKTPVQSVVQHNVPLFDIYASLANCISIEEEQTYCRFKGDKIQIPRKHGELLSILPYWAGSDELIAKKLKNYRLTIFRTVSSNFSVKKAILTKNTKRGYYEEVIPDILPVISLDVFTVACFDALEKGLVSKRPRLDDTGGLGDWGLNVTVGIVTNMIRLDHALALLKLAGRDIDAYGDQLLGAVPYHSHMKTKDRKWKLVYDLDPSGNIDKNSEASIDHVKAKSTGGVDKLVNMQLMKTSSNSAKGSLPTHVESDPIETMRILDVLADGMLLSHEDDLEDDVFCSIITLIDGEYDACAVAARIQEKKLAEARNEIALKKRHIALNFKKPRRGKRRY